MHTPSVEVHVHVGQTTKNSWYLASLERCDRHLFFVVFCFVFKRLSVKAERSLHVGTVSPERTCTLCIRKLRKYALVRPK